MAANSLWIAHPDNYATTATITATTADTLYPVTNLGILPITSVWRSALSLSATISIDLGSARSVTFLALVNHNLRSDATITINGGTTPGGTTFTQSGMTWGERINYVKLSSAQSYRYWTIIITDAFNADAFLEIGYLVIGAVVAPTFMFRLGWQKSKDIATAKVETEFGIPYEEELYERARLQLNFGPLYETEMTVLRTLYTTVCRNTYPFLIVPVVSEAVAYFGRIQNMFDERVDFLRYGIIQFQEDSYGQRIN